MTRNVIAIRANAPITEAINLMLRSHVSGLPVLDEQNALVGMLSEGDLLRRGELGTEKKRPRWIEFLLGPGKMAGDYVRSHGRKVEEVMTHDVITTTQTADLGEAVELMNRHGIKRLPVMFNSRVVGMITRADLLRALARMLPKPAPAASDEQLRAAILAELDRQNWAPVGWLDVSVADGVVEFQGTIADERQREALRVVAENVEGVKGIRDHLVWIEPASGAYLLSPEDKREGQGDRPAA